MKNKYIRQLEKLSKELNNKGYFKTSQQIEVAIILFKYEQKLIKEVDQLYE